MRTLREIAAGIAQVALGLAQLSDRLRELAAIQRDVATLTYELNLIRRRLDQPHQIHEVFPEVGPVGAIVSDVAMAEDDNIWRRRPYVQDADAP